jgi:hypothetical protein
MMFHVRLGRFRGVVRGVLIMAVREMRVMRRRFMLPVFVVLGRVLVVMRRVLVMFGRCVMMVRCLLGHAFLHSIALSNRLNCGTAYRGSARLRAHDFPGNKTACPYFSGMRMAARQLIHTTQGEPTRTAALQLLRPCVDLAYHAYYHF